MTSLPRLLTALLAVVLLTMPAAAHASASLETGIADDAAVLYEPNDAKAAATVAQWAAAGIDDVRIFAQWQAIAPANSEVRAPAGFNSADPNSPGYDWSRVDRAVNLVSAAGLRPMLVVTGPRAGVGLAGARAPQRPLQAAPGPLRPVRPRRGAALRRRGRSLDHLERAQPPAVAAAAEHVQGQALHALRAAPVPPPGPRGLPGDQDRRPDLDGPLRRPGPQRRELDQAERQDAPAGLHPLDGLRQGHAQARSQRAVRGLQAAHRRRPGLPPARHQARARRAAVGPRQRLDRRHPAARAHARRHAARGRPQEGRRRQVPACTSPSGATRRGRPTARAGSRWPSSRAICSRAPTSPIAIPGSGC